MNPIKPPALRNGDLIGIVSPASPVDDSTKIEKGVRYLESHGYRTIIGTHAQEKNGYLAGFDKDRADDLHQMFLKKEVRAIIAVRGGYGTPRLLSLLDYSIIKRNPKILVGFSDLTALQLAIWKHVRMITFHGPMLASDMAGTIDPYTEEMFWRLVSSKKAIGNINLSENDTITLAAGRAKGILLGGNLSLLVNLVGTPHCPNFRNSLLFVEEVGEEPYRVDRMLVQLREAGILKNASGFLAGQFADCVPKDSKPSASVNELFSQCADLLDKPFLSNLPFGHVPRKLTLPIGLQATLDAGKRNLQFVEAAVS
ncbi:MAG TPA: LD-carboxypeptidase [Bacteroidota bacterium]|jgi:muramoyltetrapeptide carboxypeptidase